MGEVLPIADSAPEALLAARESLEAARSRPCRRPAGRVSIHAAAAFERHFTPKELGGLWGLSDTKIRRMFENEPGVLREGAPSRRFGRKLKRRYYTLRIPESIAVRVHRRLCS